MAKQRATGLWIKLRFGDDGEVGPGKIALLRRIEEQRSISGAARAMGMSYRRAWLLIDELNRQCGRAAVETHIGGSAHGGARLTPFGAQLIRAYDAIVERSSRACEKVLRELEAATRRKD